MVWNSPIPILKYPFIIAGNCILVVTLDIELIQWSKQKALFLVFLVHVEMFIDACAESYKHKENEIKNEVEASLTV
jgi:hypothetical protein